MKAITLATMSAAAALSCSMPAPGRVISFEVKSVEPAFEGTRFGDVGQYQIVKSIAHFAVDPTDPLNANIVDINRATKNADGLVEFDADVMVIRPVDLKAGNGRFVLEQQNRGTNHMRAARYPAGMEPVHV